MELNIKYNEETDEFSEDLSLQMRLHRYIKKHFYPAFIISNLAPIYLVGGSIRDLMFAKVPKDLDFVVLGHENLEWIKQVMAKFDIEYGFNRFGGFKFTYGDTTIDLWTAEDLLSAIQYNVDGLFYDLRTNSFLSLTFNDFINNGIRLINSNNNVDNGRELKLQKFAEKFNNK